MKHRSLVLLGILLLLLSACSDKPLLQDVSISPTIITPNADGDTDLAKIEFLLNRSATVAITLFDKGGNEYIFRAPSRLPVHDDAYTVYFGGVVEGYTLPDETYDYTILKRMLPDGDYTWKSRQKPLRANAL